jgi:hypothetical protein
MIRALVTSNPSPAYIARVADAFANSQAGRGDMKALITAVLLDPEARSDTGVAASGKLKDPILHTVSLMRAMNGTLVNPANLFWEYSLLGEELISAPTVFSFFSPLTKLPGQAEMFGPEFQIYTPALAVARSNFIFRMLNGDMAGMIRIDLTPYVNAAGDPYALVNLVDAHLAHGRMSPATRQAILASVTATTDNRQRAITALYLTAISADFAVQH